MADFGKHVRILVEGLLVGLLLFLLTSAMADPRFVRQVFVSIVILVLVIYILARFGGNIGGTL